MSCERRSCFTLHIGYSGKCKLLFRFRWWQQNLPPTCWTSQFLEDLKAIIKWFWSPFAFIMNRYKPKLNKYWALLSKISPFVSGEQINYSCICWYRWLRLNDDTRKLEYWVQQSFYDLTGIRFFRFWQAAQNNTLKPLSLYVYYACKATDILK